MRTKLLIASALAAAFLLTGCTSDPSTDSGGAGVSNVAPARDSAQQDAAEPAPAAPDQAEGGAATGKDTPAQAPDLSVDQRSIIYRGSVSVRVDDVNAKAAQAIGIVTTAGGYVGGDNRSSTGDGSGSATLQLRVPADKFTATIDQLSELSDEESREINTEDVTEQVVDLDARITVQQARVDSGRRLLSQAKSLNDLVMLEKEVATREADLASLQGKKNRLADLTALSTITVTFLGPTAALPETEDPPGFLSGLAAGWNALLVSLKVLLTVLGALLPWVIALGLPLWALWYLYGRFGKGRWGGRPALATTGGTLPVYATPPPAPATDAEDTAPAAGEPATKTEKTE